MENTFKTVDEYIVNQPREFQGKLAEIRGTIKEASPGSIETMEYFQIPGYAYEGYDYNGMFVWFSFANNSIRLHVRPPVLQDFKDEVKNYKTTKAIISFPMDEKLPLGLVTKLVRASIIVMKDKSA